MRRANTKSWLSTFSRMPSTMSSSVLQLMALSAFAPCHCPGLPWSTMHVLRGGSVARPRRSKMDSESLANSPNDGPGGGGVGASKAVACEWVATPRSDPWDPSAKITFLHLHSQQLDGRSSIFLGIMTDSLDQSRARIRLCGLLDLLVEPLLSKPFQRRFEGRTSRMMEDDGGVNDPRVRKLVGWKRGLDEPDLFT